MRHILAQQVLRNLSTDQKLPSLSPYFFCDLYKIGGKKHHTKKPQEVHHFIKYRRNSVIHIFMSLYTAYFYLLSLVTFASSLLVKSMTLSFMFYYLQFCLYVTWGRGVHQTGVQSRKKKKGKFTILNVQQLGQSFVSWFAVVYWSCDLTACLALRRNWKFSKMPSYQVTAKPVTSQSWTVGNVLQSCLREVMNANSWPLISYVLVF